MKNFKSKSSVVLIGLFCAFLTACQVSCESPQEEYKSELHKQLVEQHSSTLQIAEEKQEQVETTIEQKKSEEPTEESISTASKLPNDVFIIESSRNYDGSQETLTLTDGLLQFWVNENMVCEKRIPIPSKVSIGTNFYEVVGNPYISKDGSLVLIQSYTNPKGEQKLDYTILTTNCSKIIPSLYYDAYVFRNCEGKYGLVFYRNNPSFPWYPYEGFGFNTVDNDFSLPKPTIIWLNKSTVKCVNFGSWGTTSYDYKDISAISVRLDVESYGELDIAQIGDSFEPVEVDDSFFDLLYEKFIPEEYNERFSKVIQTINEYKQKR